MQAFQCDKCEQFVAGKPDARIGQVSTELEGEAADVSVMAVILYGLDGEELELCNGCRFYLVSAAVSKESA